MLSIQPLFRDLVDHGAFVAAVATQLESLYARGAASTLAENVRVDADEKTPGSGLGPLADG
ncbi:hypothetical protein [Sphingomonas sp. PAMC 26605]|uniref:hypothetical protein n=1 Tax=Sphingomonas sp. PAMC 26605 TaxID=1112214 RepID=UPI00026CCA6D|nr:hypothetical protein [Sphingomonas sp. PAMC 26605]